MCTSLLCRNQQCPYNEKLAEPVSFSFSAVYTPFEGDKCSGKCSIKPHFCGFQETVGDFMYEGAECGVTARDIVGCDRIDCLHNENYLCNRIEILVDRLNDMWVCKCFALGKIRGHMDWSQLLKPDGTAKGGSIDDDYAMKMHENTLKFKSFGSWHREGKVDNRKKASHDKQIY